MMHDSQCSVPLCERVAVAAWDTLNNQRTSDDAPGSMPVCELHLWVLEHGGRLTLRREG